MLTLRYEHQGVEKTHRLKDGVSIVGRLPTCDIVLNDPSVSRHHATLRVDDGRCYCQDTGSRFGTFINGEQILAVADATEVKSGDVLKFGELPVTLEQNIPETELLSENHQVSEGVGVIMLPAESRRLPAPPRTRT
jgi:pSer/pThr/pTyr-binding forkhead associated (FHA) protein